MRSLLCHREHNKITTTSLYTHDASATCLFSDCIKNSFTKFWPENWLTCCRYAAIWLVTSIESSRDGFVSGLKSGLLEVSSSGSGASPLAFLCCASARFLARYPACADFWRWTARSQPMRPWLLD